MTRLVLCILILGGTVAFLSCGDSLDGNGPMGGHGGTTGLGGSGATGIGGSGGTGYCTECCGTGCDGAGPAGGRGGTGATGIGGSGGTGGFGPCDGLGTGCGGRGGTLGSDGTGPVGGRSGTTGGGGRGGTGGTGGCSGPPSCSCGLACDGVGPIVGRGGFNGSDGIGPVAGRGGTGGLGGMGGTGSLGPCAGLAYFQSRGWCAATYAQQIANSFPGNCQGSVTVYTGTCGGQLLWTTRYTSVGDPITCAYDTAGNLAGARICTDTAMPAWNCNAAPTSPSCLAAGAVPNMIACPLMTTCNGMGGRGGTGPGGCVTGCDGTGPIGGRGGN